ncbi:glucose-6-phosphate isomerase [Sulfurihydrogenibium azorense Az-Fu1]|uniref:Glucose-6-phosphate isomerase n=1 Tax=Sulfurihydrogenibium azorense (strain DSM 15241 / OCM 825 / Az-Fu1) TaxID=204536 RepID=C1DTC4_SULAA|nr:glucose-6-phosphate isomerase [Sulfurihydrogenibium azorense]ACN99580.1 glucose-6-phosphate isomerase [Sulfurihydrogenibium azorense Az-Fu1]MDM7274419.1 glucose-6-phosphate isomerase [Sulfurihydrogenibium azorense]
MIKIDYTNVMAKIIGEKDGIIPQEFDEYNHIVHEIHEKILKEKDTHFYFTKLPYQDTQEIKTLAKEIRENFDYFVVIGIGGSALGNQMIQEAINGFNYNNFEFPKLYILDNVDPEKFGNILDLIDIRKTIFNVITKSGSTVETMANFAIIYTTLKELLPETYKNHLIFTTDPEKGFLRKFGQLEGIKTLDIPPAVGGRFSVLTSVGLLSAAVCGIDIDALLEGAKKADKICSKTSIVIENPAYLIGLIHYIAAEKKGKSISVMMPYFERLSSFVDWYRQLWAESLGKQGYGQTPVKAIGTIDQHSQIQLFREGPKDKIVTFIQVEKSLRDFKIPSDLPPEISYLSGYTLKEILDMELLGTRAALTKSKVPNLTITIDELNPYNLGMLIYIYELATGFTGYLYKINPFDQPAVEEGKNFAYGLMGRKGYEEKLREFKELNRQEFILEL